MEQRDKTAKLLIEHYQAYPLLQIQDIFKYLYQSSFGCEHMVSSTDLAIECIRKEWEESCGKDEIFIDTLDGDYSRVHLRFLNYGLNAETLGRLFVASAKSEINGKENLEHKLMIARELVRKGELPFSEEEFEKKVGEWKGCGYPAIHHSEIFRSNYHPSYRVIANRFLEILPLNKI